MSQTRLTSAWPTLHKSFILVRAPWWELLQVIHSQGSEDTSTKGAHREAGPVATINAIFSSHDNSPSLPKCESQRHISGRTTEVPGSAHCFWGKCSVLFSPLFFLCDGRQTPKRPWQLRFGVGLLNINPKNVLGPRTRSQK
jgi:hypothetical protein